MLRLEADWPLLEKAYQETAADLETTKLWMH